MSFEHIEEFANTTEETCIFEEMPYTRNMGVAKENELLAILKDSQEFWRLPTVAELYALRKQNKSNFFKQKSYWAGDSSSEVREVRFGLFKPTWFFSKENQNREIYLVLIKKGTVIEGIEEQQKEIEEQGNGLPF
ncbi:MAG: hypothetical protein RLY49_511 [Candidatus Parcubacteria bacterium]|jgi:hypothetical protein